MPEPAVDPRRLPRNWGAFLAAVAAATLYYELGNYFFYPDFEVARRHALELWALQQSWGLDLEPALQNLVDQVTLFGFPWLMVFLVLFYVGPHFLLTFGFFGWAYWRRFEHFARVRNVFLIFTVTSFGFQWAYPLAPPRLIPETGLRYTLDEWLPVSGNSPTIMALTNPYAALPSVHTGWAFLVAYFMVRLNHRPRRHLWWLYPATIMLSIFATGNHFILDVVAAVPFLLLAFGLDVLLRSKHKPHQGAVPEPLYRGTDERLKRRLDALAAIPATTRSLQHPRNWAAGARLFLDYAATVPPRMSQVASRIRHYPAPFAKHELRARDGTRLVAWIGVHEGQERPGLIIVPGLFTSKDNAVVKKRSLRIFRQWGFHVMSFDLRGNGESDRVPSTVGWKEADDLIDAAQWFRTMAPLTSVAVYAESLAATAAILAAQRAASQGVPFADGGVLAVSGYSDPSATIELYTNPPKQRPDLAQVANFFTLLLRFAGMDVRTFRDYHELGCRHYDVDPAAAARQSDTAVHDGPITDPLLVLHSDDDTLVPVEQARRLEPRTDQLALWRLPWGHHCLYEMAAPDWFWTVLERFFEAPAATKEASD
jgi:pimeloyl-ACP methyl ester carboxylesterase